MRSSQILGNDPQTEEEHLRLSHGLTKVDAWVAVRGDEGMRSGPRSESASRMAKLRARKRDAGLVSIDVPAVVAAEIKARGGWEKWRAASAAAAVRDALERAAREWGMALTDVEALFKQPLPWQRVLLRWIVRGKGAPQVKVGQEQRRSVMAEYRSPKPRDQSSTRLNT